MSNKICSFYSDFDEDELEQLAQSADEDSEDEDDSNAGMEIDEDGEGSDVKTAKINSKIETNESGDSDIDQEDIVEDFELSDDDE